METELGGEYAGLLSQARPAATRPLTLLESPAMEPSRRTLSISSLGAASALAFLRQAIAAAPLVSVSDPMAVALGYVLNATTVNEAKYPNYAAGQTCGNCAYYLGKLTDATAPCTMLGGKQVEGAGWCRVYQKKA